MSSPTPEHWLIIPSAGIGSRMQMDCPKQYLRIGDRTILEHTLACFQDYAQFKKILIGVAAEDETIHSLRLEQMFPRVGLYKGGRARAQTVLNGLDALSDLAEDHDWVWVHDAARPCLSDTEISALFECLKTETSGLVLSVPVADTLKKAGKPSGNVQQNMFQIEKTIDRDQLWRAMTPQIFMYSELKSALIECLAQGASVTDESSAIEFTGGQPSLVEGSDENIKVTLARDLAKVEGFLRAKQAGSASPITSQNQHNKANERKKAMMLPKIGTGFDVHAFGEGEFITLGGVQIPYQQGLIAHSDGDVLLHALMDALLGALSLGDIGKHFPDTDIRWKGADSRELLRQVRNLVEQKGYLVGNVDSTIIAQAPKMAPFIEQMQINIAEDLKLPACSVSVKATTTERLGFTGRKEGIASQASILLFPASACSERSEGVSIPDKTTTSSRGPENK